MRGLYTDLYELKMAAAYLHRGMTEAATFSLFVRELPPQRGFLVAAGLEDVLDVLEGFRFDDEDLSYLRETSTVSADVVEVLAKMRFSGDVWAVPEGRLVFPHEPLLEITAPIWQAQLVQTAVLNLVTHQTTIASKAARCRLAARGARLVDVSLPRAPGLAGGTSVSRAAAIAGFDATSNMAAAARYRLPAAGTMAHSFVEAFPTRRQAFDAFLAEYGPDSVLLVDTYRTLQGVREAIEAARSDGVAIPAGVRLGSGDLHALAVRTRHLLDDAGLTGTQITVSGGLDEYAIDELVASGAPIDAYGVGTAMGLSADAPSLDSVCTLVQYGDRPVLRLSEGTSTLPGPKQVFRGREPGADLIALRSEARPGDSEPLLLPVMRDGRRSGEADWAGVADDVHAARRRFGIDLERLGERARRLYDPVAPRVPVSRSLRRLRDDLERGVKEGRDAVRG
jgi:nicotinate phosphoribosyltransferase